MGILSTFIKVARKWAATPVSLKTPITSIVLLLAATPCLRTHRASRKPHPCHLDPHGHHGSSHRSQLNHQTLTACAAQCTSVHLLQRLSMGAGMQGTAAVTHTRGL